MLFHFLLFIFSSFIASSNNITRRNISSFNLQTASLTTHTRASVSCEFPLAETPDKICYYNSNFCLSFEFPDFVAMTFSFSCPLHRCVTGGQRELHVSHKRATQHRSTVRYSLHLRDRCVRCVASAIKTPSEVRNSSIKASAKGVGGTDGGTKGERG